MVPVPRHPASRHGAWRRGTRPASRRLGKVTGRQAAGRSRREQGEHDTRLPHRRQPPASAFSTQALPAMRRLRRRAPLRPLPRPSTIASTAFPGHFRGTSDGHFHEHFSEHFRDGGAGGHEFGPAIHAARRNTRPEAWRYRHASPASHAHPDNERAGARVTRRPGRQSTSEIRCAHLHGRPSPLAFQVGPVRMVCAVPSRRRHPSGDTPNPAPADGSQTNGRSGGTNFCGRRSSDVLGVKPRNAAGQSQPEPDSSPRRRGEGHHHVPDTYS